ncbi:hypothetical protein E2562_030511 [Oryza meyeriana var. granulata]|uniref:Uncharacterized protein n=1 Tax=Oryza meyeriana var. granulata TaxID=110450 RepID=A0A6G1BP16_9ORYZ|nr:hypothetical protein E2562_030511 [Oryza meyeriana var. granulata]
MGKLHHPQQQYGFHFDFICCIVVFKKKLEGKVIVHIQIRDMSADSSVGPAVTTAATSSIILGPVPYSTQFAAVLASTEAPRRPSLGATSSDACGSLELSGRQPMRP